jgi:ubiquinone/menaquinone biosynthesis C-methylase UbiE
MNKFEEKLILLPLSEYLSADRDDPIRQYNKPVFGRLYRKRMEMCLQCCSGGNRVLDVGYGSGVAFLNLARKYKQIYGLDLKSNAEEIMQMFARKGLNVKLLQGNLLQMPYEDNFFDTILLVSILEHLQPENLSSAFRAVKRILKIGGQVVYGIPVDNKLTRLGFWMLGYNIRRHHYSNERHVHQYAQFYFRESAVIPLRFPFLGIQVYEVGEFIKEKE